MAKYVLDNEGTEIMRLSNDAFLYLTQEEEPLDEDNLIEAQQLYEEFPLGFEIVDYQYANNGEVIVKIVPYIEAPVIIKPKVIKTRTSKKKMPAAQIKEPSLSEKELTADFFKYWVDAAYKRKRKLSSSDILWLTNAKDFFKRNQLDDYVNKIENLMAS